MRFIRKVRNKYKVRATSSFTYPTTLEMWKENDKVYAYVGSKNPKVDITHVFNKNETTWLDDVTEDDMVEVDIIIDFDCSFPTPGSYAEPPDGGEIDPTEATILYGQGKKIKADDLLHVKLHNGETYGDSLSDNLMEFAMDKANDRDDY